MARKLVLSPATEADLASIAAWTAVEFGDRQAGLYVDAIIETIEELLSDKPHPRTKARDEIAPGLRSLHIAKRGRRGRHLLLYLENQSAVTIVRILHDSMEIAAYLPKGES